MATKTRKAISANLHTFVCIARTYYDAVFESDDSHTAQEALEQACRLVAEAEGEDQVDRTIFNVYEVVSVKEYEAKQSGFVFTPVGN